VRRAPTLIAAVLAALVIAGCGDDGDETTTVTETTETSTTSSSTSTTTTETSDGPSGELSPSAIGVVEIGAAEDDVIEAFGEPHDRQAVDLGGGGVAPQENWVYELPGGDVTLKFDTGEQALDSYDVYTSTLTTAEGIKVGDPESLLEKTYGGDLTDSPIGLDSLVFSEGSPGTEPALTFALDNGKIIAITGGSLVQPAGE